MANLLQTCYVTIADADIGQVQKWALFSELPHAVLQFSACISACGDTHFRVYFRMLKYT